MDGISEGTIEGLATLTGRVPSFLEEICDDSKDSFGNRDHGLLGDLGQGSCPVRIRGLWMGQVGGSTPGSSMARGMGMLNMGARFL